jgi:hypothetical protein
VAEAPSGLGGALSLDSFAVRVRVLPVLAVSAPLLTLLIAIVWPLLPNATWRWSSLSAAIALLVVLAQQWGREPGRSAQEQLWRDWGGAPATQLLRWRGPVPTVEQRRRHQQLQQLLGATPQLPSAAEETNDPDAADAVYRVALTTLISRTQDKNRFPLLKKELSDYNFRRNLYGLRRRGQGSVILTLILVLALTAVGVLAPAISGSWGRFDVSRSAPSAAALAISAAVAVVALVLWARTTSAWVKSSAFTYAHELLKSLEQLATEPPTPNATA